MTATSTALNCVGIVMLLHAVYSAYEHRALTNASAGPPSSNAFSTDRTGLDSSTFIDIKPAGLPPIDITVEVLLSVLLLSLGTVLGAPPLRLVRWHCWAGRVEREGGARRQERELLALATGQKWEDAEGLGASADVVAALEERPGFKDIRSGKKEFDEWKSGQRI